MPYASNADLPASLREILPSLEGQSLFRRVVNSQLNADKTEATAMSSAWAALKNAGYSKQEGKWVKKLDVGDVHTARALDDLSVLKAKYQGEDVELNKPFRTPGESKKFAVYVQDGDSVKIVRFGDSDMEIRRDDDEARANFRARHNCDQKTDKTTAGYWSCKMWEKGSSVADVLNKADDFRFNCTFSKINEDQRLVYGFASIIKDENGPVVDFQGDVISEQELVKAAHGYVMKSRAAKVMHKGAAKGEIVESIVLTDEVKKILKSETPVTGWFIGMKIHDDAAWKAVKSGELRMFSIGGKGRRQNA